MVLLIYLAYLFQTVFLESSQSSSPVMKVPFKFGKKNMTRERMLKTSNRRRSGSEGGIGNLPQGARLFIPQVSFEVVLYLGIQSKFILKV